jgi:RNA polymerase sigma factor (sigma-70 family)
LNSKESRFLAQLEPHRGILFKICRTFQGSADDQKDLYQEILVQLWLSFDSFREESRFSTWMYRVAFNTAIVFYRKARNQTERYSGLPMAEVEEELQTFADREEQIQVLYRAIQQLNGIEKAIIFLYLEGKTGREISVVLGITASHVRVRVNRTKEKLKYIIKTLGYEF